MHNFFGSASDITKSYIVYFFCVCQKFDFKRYKYKYLCASPRHSIAWFIVSAKIDHYTLILALQILHTKSNTTSFSIEN